MQAMGGEQFWESKKLELSMQKEDERKRGSEPGGSRKGRKRYKYREDQVRRRMGSIKYYLMPKNRAKYYEVYPLPKKYRVMEEQERARAKRELSWPRCGRRRRRAVCCAVVCVELGFSMGALPRLGEGAFRGVAPPFATARGAASWAFRVVAARRVRGAPRGVEAARWARFRACFGVSCRRRFLGGYLSAGEAGLRPKHGLV